MGSQRIIKAVHIQILFHQGRTKLTQGRILVPQGRIFRDWNNLVAQRNIIIAGDSGKATLNSMKNMNRADIFLKHDHHIRKITVIKK